MLRMRFVNTYKLIKESALLTLRTKTSSVQEPRKRTTMDVNQKTGQNNKMILRPLVICGPSGSGKSTLLKKLFNDYPDCFGFSVSHTTRKPRNGERGGVEYHFTTVDAMEDDIKEGQFIEHAMFSGNMYGTSKRAVESVKMLGKICVLDIEMQGVQQVKKTDLNPLYIFIKPPSIETLEERLRLRGTETAKSMQMRLETAEKEVKYGTSENFDLIVENDNLDTAYVKLRAFLIEQLNLKGNRILNGE